MLSILAHHTDNLLPSTVSPNAVNGTTMTPWGKMQVTLKLGQQTCKEDIYIYPGVSGTIISWKAAKVLGIFAWHYPYPPNWKHNHSAEHFIILAEGAKPFCVKAPLSVAVPFAYREKLKAELELLQQQNIIAPVTQVTEWCVVMPKRGTDRMWMCVDLSRLNKYVCRERYHSAAAVSDIAAEEAHIFNAMKRYISLNCVHHYSINNTCDECGSYSRDDE